MRHIDEEALQLLLKTPDQDTFPGRRDFAMLCLTLDSGLRPQELVSILKEDVNLKSFEIKVRSKNAKTRKSRTLPITAITAESKGVEK
ncbi:MAG: tyrosine-type recombinase/integrase [Bacillota bacterium]